MICKICTALASNSFSATILRTHEADFFYCPECGFLFTDNPHWLDTAYSSPITISDTGILARNLSISRRLCCILYLFGPNPLATRYVDIAGGYGLLTRLMRDIGFDFYWSDPYCENLFARGFEFSEDLYGCGAVTAMEVIEHVSDPIRFVEESLSSSGAEMMIFTTELFEDAPPDPLAWWYYAFETGQHISFYQMRTLKVIADRLGLNFVSSRGLHVFSRKKINNGLLRLVTHPVVSHLVEVWLRRHLLSKTVADHNSILCRS